jgi:hypothetical protein
VLRFAWYFCLLAWVGLLFASVLLGVDFGWCILRFYYFVWNVVGVGQTTRSRRLESAWMGAVVMKLCELGTWRACVRFRRLPCSYGGTPRPRSGLA